VRRTASGYIDRIDLGNRYYEFAINPNGVVTQLKHVGSVPAF
jgi:hypothetical protein